MLGYCGESAFYPGVIWTSDVEGFQGNGSFIPEFSVAARRYTVTDFSTLALEKPIKVGTGVDEHYEMKVACYIRIDGDQIHRIQGKKECPTGLAYDFAMQPGDVRQVVALESKLGTADTWVKCPERRASATFPGRDEIHLAEFADAACTQHIGDGIWVTGIGSIYGVLANSRFAETGAGSQLKKVSQYDQVIWDGANLTLPAPAGIETVEAADADAPAVYYNLQGIRVDNPSNGVFIRVDGSKTTKVIL